MGGSRFFFVFFSGSAEYHNTVSYYGMSIKTEEVKPKIKLTLEFLRSKVLFPSVAELLFCFYPFRRAAVRAGVRHMLDSNLTTGEDMYSWTDCPSHNPISLSLMCVVWLAFNGDIIFLLFLFYLSVRLSVMWFIGFWSTKKSE
jgi:hypothetical protein